ncbi:MAG: hypothetical protein HYY91_04925 [Candidatus Omnitrophica bacterium]|nr:hypothetical protein [Candidatus Omnitrophota bacterium]
MQSGVLGGIILVIFRLGKISERFTTLERTVTGSESEIKSVRDMVIKITSALVANKTIEQGFITTHSPTVLTEIGVRMLQESGFMDVFRLQGQKILDAVEAKSPKLKYDAEEISIDVLLSMRDDPIMEPLKSYAFQHGLNLTEMLIAAGIYVRDRVIEELHLAK